MRRRYIYLEDAQEIEAWAKEMKEKGLLEREPNCKGNFPFYLQQYIKHLKVKGEE